MKTRNKLYFDGRVKCVRKEFKKIRERKTKDCR